VGTLNPVDLSIQVCDEVSVRYLPIPNARFTENQINQVFVRELKDGQSFNWKEWLEEPVPLAIWRRNGLTIERRK